MLNLNSLLLFSEDPAGLTEFYKKILQKDTEWSAGNFSGFKVGDGFLTIGPHNQVHGKSKEPERIMFNFETGDVEGEFRRIKSLGATVIATPYHPAEEPTMWIATLADKDGNFFQLLSPMK